MSWCYADPHPIYHPAMRLIAVVSQANPCQVTTTFAHQYKDGAIVRLDIPEIDGMMQLAGTQWPITVTGSTTFTIPVDSTNFQPFSIPGSPPFHVNTCAQVIPLGEISSTLASATLNVLPFNNS